MSSTTDNETVDSDVEVAQEAAQDQQPEPKTIRDYVERAVPRSDAAEKPEAETAQEPEYTPRKYPGSWRKEVEPVYRKAETLARKDAEFKALLDEIDKRESDYFSGVSKYKQGAEAAQAYQQALGPYMPTIKQLGLEPHVAVQSLLEADRRLRHGTDQERAAYYAQLGQMYGITKAEAARGGETQSDPLYSELKGEISRLQSHIHGIEQRNRVASEAEVSSEVNTFAQGKEHFEAVREDMAALIQSGLVNTLDEAYERSLWLNPETRQKLLHKQMQEADDARKKEQAEAAKKARSMGVQVRGSSTPGGGAANVANLRASLEDAFSNRH